MRTWLLFLLLLSTLAPARAAELFVHPGGSNTIQDVIDQAGSGDTIYLMPGVFSGPGNADLEVGIDLTIISNEFTDPAIIDCQGSSADPRCGVRILGGNVALEHLIISNGHADQGGAVQILGGTVLLNHCRLEDCTAETEGGAIFVQAAQTLTLDHVLCAGSQAGSRGGAVSIDSLDQLDVTSCTVVGHGGPVPLDGTAIYAAGPTAINITSSLFALGGQGTLIAAAEATLDLSCTDIYGNLGGDWVGNLAGLDLINNNLCTDPMFCQVAAGDFQLAYASPCLGFNNDCNVNVGALGLGCSEVTAAGDPEPLPAVVSLLGNHPNPFNPRTTIAFALPADGPVSVAIHDITGRLVRLLVNSQTLPAGNHRIVWDGKDEGGMIQSSGIYLYRVTAAGQTQSGKMAMIR